MNLALSEPDVTMNIRLGDVRSSLFVHRPQASSGISADDHALHSFLRFSSATGLCRVLEPGRSAPDA